MAGRGVWRLGRHEALWSLLDYEALQIELRRRKEVCTHRLSNLVECGLCGRKMVPGLIQLKHDPPRLAWCCQTTVEFRENVVWDADVLRAVSRIIGRDLRRWQAGAKRDGTAASREALRRLAAALRAEAAVIETGPAPTVNEMLRRVISKVIVRPGGVEIVRR